MKTREWWVTTARFSGVIAGYVVSFGEGNFIFGNYEAAAWLDERERNYQYIAHDGLRGARADFHEALRMATGVALSGHEPCPTCGRARRA